ncbi:MAG: carbohydrate-binding protein [Variovorax paradoxus]|nr:MAG: carbohydrate-binding protein [Variovorax paradoxus]PZQ08939.1 MAG: carbohydrate-binding protein [Variovorax paradoxus]
MTFPQIQVVRPLAIAPAMLVATNLGEDALPEWSAGTPYALGVRVMVTAQHKVYESLVSPNTGNAPWSSPAHWVEVSPTNRWKAFDQSNSTQTRAQNFLTYSLKTGQAVDSVAALNLVGATAMRVRVQDPVLGLIYDKTVSLAGQLKEATWWDFFFGERTDPKQCIYTDVPSAPAATITVELAGTEDLAVGVIMLGQLRSFSLGVKLGARVGITDYSRKERNEFGDTILVERPYSRRANFALVLAAMEVDSFVAYMAEVRAQPCLWIGSKRYEAMTLYGIYKNFDVLIEYHDYSTCELELEGLT